MNIFEPLDASKNEIRLLDILLADDEADEIGCNLRIVSLDEHVAFDALSWCWGDDTTSGCINVCGQVFECSPNLEAALRNFRDSSATRTMWVDAVCINQHDLEEKSTQIPLMARIYAEADFVRVWLGEAADGSDDAVEVVKQLLAGSTLDDCRLGGAPLNIKTIQSLCLFLERPWWQRIWVAQEVALARSAVMYCGRASFELAGLPKALDDTLNRLIVAGGPFQHIHSDTMEKLRRRLNSGLLSLAPILQMLSEAKAMKSAESPPCFTVDSINALSSLKATDPRDKVYGCLGLLPGLSKLIKPDYNVPTDLVYIITTWALILHARCLYPLCFSVPRRLFKVGNEDMIFPSWSLDFSHKAMRAPKLSMMFSSCGTWGPFTTEIRYPFIETPAVFFDEIESCFKMSPSWHAPVDAVQSARAVHSRWRSFLGLELDQSNYSAYIGGGSVENAYWRIVVGDSYHDLQQASEGQRLTSTQIKPFVKWIRNEKSYGLSPDFPEYETNRNVVEYHYAVHRSTADIYNTYLFKTRKGYLGMSAGVREIHAGDHLYFMDRGQVPWILRPLQDEVEGTVFEVASECYVHGIMDGEAFRSPPGPDSKTWKRHELRRKMFGGQPLNTDFPMPPWTRILLT